MKDNREKLLLWQTRLSESDAAYGAEVSKMNQRERLYNGEHTLRPLVPGDLRRDGGVKKTSHVRNIIFENIESEVSSAIPQPKVTPRRKQDERLAAVIEHFLRNELDRLPFEQLNDMAERTVPIQGGVGFLVEWDNSQRTQTTVGEVRVSVIHPKQFAPQPGVYTDIEDMDWFIVKVPTTKGQILREYGVNLSTESESEPEVRGTGGEAAANDAVTRYVGFARNSQGGLDRYTWVNDVELEDLENYQARRQPVCVRCGTVRPPESEKCPNCGGDRFESREQEFSPVMISNMGMQMPPMPPMQGAGQMPVPGAQVPGMGAQVPGMGAQVPGMGAQVPGMGAQVPGMRGNGFDASSELRAPNPDEGRLAESEDLERVLGRRDVTTLTSYRPDVFPIVLQRNVSVYGQLLGNSDVDVIRDQQNTVNRLEQKIIDRLVKAGTRVTLPDRADLRIDPEDGERWYIGNAADKAMIGVYEFKGDLEYELLYLANVYEEARQVLGITDSFQGRRDATATSGKAKEFAAAQSAGRLESKRTMKNAAYARLFELMFKFWLAYSDEPRTVSYHDFKGETQYETFDRFDFLEQDAAGNFFWNDQFLFSCDTSAPLASNREALWQETRQNLQTGAFGDPTQTETLILFWSKMEELHYPGAGSTKAFLEDKLAQTAGQQIPVQQPEYQQMAVQQPSSQQMAIDNL